MSVPPPVTLNSLLSHPTWRHVVRLAGSDRDPGIRAVTVIRDLCSRVPPAPETLLTVLYSRNRRDWHLDAVMARAHDMGISAILVEGIEALTPASRALSERLALPIIGAANPLPTSYAADRLFERPESVAADLNARIIRGGRTAAEGIEGAIAAIESAVGRDAALLDTQGVVVAGFLGVDGHLIMADLPSGLPPDPVLLAWPDEPDAIVAYPVRTAGSSGWLVLAAPRSSPAELQSLVCAVPVAALLVERQLATARVELERDARQRSWLVGEILGNNLSEQVRRRALDQGWELEGWHTGIRVDVPSGVDGAGLRQDVIASLVRAGLRDPVVAEYGDGVVAWVTNAQQPSAEQVVDTAARLRKAQRHLRGATAGSMGVGRVHHGASGIALTVSEAADAARLAHNRPESGYFVHVDRLGLAQLLLAWTSTDTFAPAAAALLGPLRDQPGDLLATLTTYLDCESSVGETAAVLGVHRNTVATRMVRIETLLDVNLSQADDRLALHLACRTMLGNQPTNGGAAG